MMPFRHVASLAVIAALGLSGSRDPATAAPPQDPPTGHLVLVVEGDVSALRVTAAVGKADDWGGVPVGLASDFALVGLDAQGEEVLHVPIDLSAFDTDPAHIGAPTVVQGCIVRSPRIGVLVNVPADDRIQDYAIRHIGATIGAATAADIAALLRGGR